MIILACNEISLSFGTDIILNKVSCNVHRGEKAALVGVNGAGKSTLFKIILGSLQQDSGDVFMSKGLRIGYLDQSSGLDSENTIWAEMLTAYHTLTSMEARLKLLEKNISQEKNEEHLHSLMKEYDRLLECFTREGGYEYNSRIRGVLRGLGFTDEEFELAIRNLSGGQKTRLALAKLLLEEPDLLLLDEPTNHLDMNAIEWLEDFLKSYKQSVIVISHDRYFLDAVTTKTIELENCECTTYSGGYSEYAKQKAIAREIQHRHYDLQQKEIARMEAFIEQQRRWNREKNIIAAQSRQKAIDRMEKLDAPKKLPGSIKIKFRSDVVSGDNVLLTDNLSKSFPGKELFKDLSIDIRRGEKTFIIGPNGCGKSTLLKILVGKIPQTEGSFEYGHKIVLGYYDQELEGLDDNNTVLEEVWDENEKLTHTQIRNALAQFLFFGEDVYKNIGILSGGEKSRVALTKLMLSGANLLVLDEPTNHLDINSREALEEALLAFDGTMLVVSHDRYFVRKLASRIIEMTNTGLEDYRGDYGYYLDHRRLSVSQASGNDQTFSSAKQEHLDSKEEKARRRKLDKQLATCEKEISSIEARITELSEEMSRNDALSDHVLLSALHEEQLDLEKRLEQLYADWSAYTEEVEHLEPI
ncbi:MAG: ABC-F type ribosomal protection protein [Clostridiaceae bacterium]|jgi:ATP-binding cassette subfamily F protein 3|nr:ABC-F type ribosomal protection protein [Clostridiaceae bacterium]